MNRKTCIIVVVIFVLAAFVSLSSYLPTRFDTTDKVQMAAFPMKIGPWTGKDVPLTKRDYEMLETTNLIMRQYTNPGGGSLLLYIIYSEDNRKVSHPPEVCYMGSGSTIAQKAVIAVTPEIKANKMVVEMSGGGRQLVAYWYKAGVLNTPDYFAQQLKVALRRTFAQKTSAAMIRISTDIKGDKEKAAEELIGKFCAQMAPLLPRYVP